MSGTAQALRGSALWAGYAALTGASFCWSTNYVVGRMIGESIPLMALSFWRCMLATLILGAFVLPRLRADWRVAMRHLPILGFFSLTGVFLPTVLAFWGVRHTTATNAVLVQAVGPLCILLWTWILWGERIGPRQIGGIALSFAGIAVLASQGSLGILLGLSINPGDALMMSTALAYSAYTAMLRRRPAMHPHSFIACSFAISSLAFLPLYIWELADGAHFLLGPPQLGGILFIAIVPTIGSFLCHTYGMERVGAARGGQFLNLIPPFGLALAILLLGEVPQTYHGVSALLIAGGLVLGAWHKARPARA